MTRPIARLALLATLLAAPSLLTTQALAQPTADARDYEGATTAPNGTTVAHLYMRHQTTTQKKNVTTNIAFFRGAYVMKFGNLTLVPFELVVPFADADLKWYQTTTPNADATKPATVSFGARPTSPSASGPGATSFRQTGIADLQFLPSIHYNIVENAAERTHTWMGANVYAYIPVGTYSARTAPLNIGENRWQIKPQIAVGQRFAKILTAELVLNTVIYMDNKSFTPIAPLPVGTMSQKSTYNAELHLAADVHETMFVSASYYLAALGEKTYTGTASTALPAAVQAGLNGAAAKAHVVAEKATVHTLRLSWGIHIEKQSLLLLQYQQDLKTAGDESNTRYVGIRFTHFWF